MSWMEKLCETYSANRGEIGDKLLPVFHITQQAQIEVVLDLDGNWCPGKSRVITDKNSMTTLIPCTEKSAGRTSAPEPHPLFDKLQYLSSQYLQYGNQKKYDYPDYIKLLAGWCESPYSLPVIRSIRTYLEKGTLISDLSREKILYQEENAFPAKWSGSAEETPPIFKACAGEQLDAFVRFRILQPEATAKDEIWRDPVLWNSWISYQKSLAQQLGVCYVTGEPSVIAELSPRKIRNAGDSAKLISSNDKTGFTFRGRFNRPEEAACVGRVTTEEAHNALRWLIARQAYSHGDQVILSWHTKTGQPTLPLCKDSVDLLGDMAEEPPIVTNGEEFARRFQSALSGYSCKLEHGAQAAVMGLNSATPGRLSIFYYREMQATDLLERIRNWHTSCCWLHTYRFVKNSIDAKGKPISTPIRFIGAPAPRDIIEAVYGTNVDDKLRHSITERLLPCIVDGAALPADIMRRAAMRAAGAAALEDSEARKVLSIACALVRKYENHRQHKEVWIVALDKDCNHRDYLFGRALAYARKIEEMAQWLAGNDKRQTNAERLTFAFSEHPARTWKLLERQLHPYLARFSARGGTVKEAEMREVLSRIGVDGFTDRPLSPVFLLGYSAQLNDFQSNEKNNHETTMEGKS